MNTLTSLTAITAFGSLLTLTSCKTETTTEAPSPGKALVMESIDAHGGIEKWRENGELQFRWSYHMSDLGKVVDTLQVVDPVSLTATHDVKDSEIQFGRADDGRYWIHPASAEFTPPPQFWTLTPIYFIGIPFVFDDSSITFDLLEEPKSFEGKDYTQVKLSYSADAGESPDDYYVLLIDPETKQTKGAYYTVTNPLVFKGGTPVEKFITLDNLQDVNGVLLSGGHKTYSMEDGVIGDQMRYTDVSEVKFLQRGTTDFAAPEGARFLDPVPASE